MKLLHKLAGNLWILRSLLKTIYFNLTQLPFRQAVKLPILLYKPRLINNRGKIIINGPVKTGMIRLGVNRASIYPNNGITIENKGIIVFEGKAFVGNSSAISVGDTGTLTIGDNLQATAAIKIVCYKNVCFHENVVVGWNCMITDTDFHRLTLPDGTLTRGYGTVEIGRNCWIANGCKIYKNATIPPYCVTGADTIVNKAVECQPRSLICNERTITVKIHNIFFDQNGEGINYN